MRYLLAFVLFTLCGSLYAAPIRVTWTNPTAREDGVAMPAAEIASTRVEYGTCNGTAFGTKQGEVVVTGAATTATTPDRPFGTHCLRAFTKDIYGLESAASAVLAEPILPSRPRPPTLLDAVLAWVRDLFSRFG